MTNRQEWERSFRSSPSGEVEGATMSGLELDAVYGPDDGAFPGQWLSLIHSDAADE